MSGEAVVCLLCPLAVFLPRHAPNLLRLKAYFARHSGRCPPRISWRVFGPYADRIDQILGRLTPAELRPAAGPETTPRQIPLRPEERTAMTPLAAGSARALPALTVRRRRCLSPAGLTPPRGRSPPGLRQRPMGLHRSRRRSRSDIPLAKRWDFAVIGDPRWRRWSRTCSSRCFDARVPRRQFRGIPHGAHPRSCHRYLDELIHLPLARPATRPHARRGHTRRIATRTWHPGAHLTRPAIAANRASRFDALPRRSSSSWSPTRPVHRRPLPADLRPWTGAPASAVAEMRP